MVQLLCALQSEQGLTGQPVGSNCRYSGVLKNFFLQWLGRRDGVVMVVEVLQHMAAKIESSLCLQTSLHFHEHVIVRIRLLGRQRYLR